jgi:hypothetical protein
VRLQLIRRGLAELVVVGLGLGLGLALPSPAAADELVIRGNYWRDRNTRVLQPEADLSKELPSGTTVGAHYLLDTITSASIAAGVVRDEPFTELRNEVGFRLGQRLGPTRHTASYSYSSESDYWAHTLSIASSFDFFDKNSTLGLVTSYGSDKIAQRQGPTLYNPLGGLQTFGFIASWSQVLAKNALLLVEYDLGVLGFGSEKGKIGGAPNASTGFQANAYRSVIVAGSPSREQVPYQRVRQALTGTLHLSFLTGGRLVPFVAFRPSYRFYLDDWSVRAHDLELRTFLPIGPTELRLTGRWHTQRAASFYSDEGGRPGYSGDASRGLPCTGCYADSSRSSDALFFTGDPKLSAFSSMFVELRLLVRLEPIFRRSRRALPRWLAEGRVELSYGHYFNDRYAETTFGGADLAGLSFAFPL